MTCQCEERHPAAAQPNTHPCTSPSLLPLGSTSLPGGWCGVVTSGRARQNATLTRLSPTGAAMRAVRGARDRIPIQTPAEQAGRHSATFSSLARSLAPLAHRYYTVTEGEATDRLTATSPAGRGTGPCLVSTGITVTHGSVRLAPRSYVLHFGHAGLRGDVAVTTFPPRGWRGTASAALRCKTQDPPPAAPRAGRRSGSAQARLAAALGSSPPPTTIRHLPCQPHRRCSSAPRPGPARLGSDRLGSARHGRFMLS